LLIQKNNSYIVVDYKTTNNQENSHIKQVQHYMKCIRHITSSDTVGYLVYLKKDSIEIVSI